MPQSGRAWSMMEIQLGPTVGAVVGIQEILTWTTSSFVSYSMVNRYLLHTIQEFRLFPSWKLTSSSSSGRRASAVLVWAWDRPMKLPRMHARNGAESTHGRPLAAPRAISVVVSTTRWNQSGQLEPNAITMTKAAFKTRKLTSTVSGSKELSNRSQNTTNSNKASAAPVRCFPSTASSTTNPSAQNGAASWKATRDSKIN